MKKVEQCHDLVRCRLVVCDFKPQHEILRGDFYVAMSPLKTKKGVFAYQNPQSQKKLEERMSEGHVCGREKGAPQLRCDEEECVELPEVLQYAGRGDGCAKCGSYALKLNTLLLSNGCAWFSVKCLLWHGS